MIFTQGQNCLTTQFSERIFIINVCTTLHGKMVILNQINRSASHNYLVFFWETTLLAFLYIHSNTESCCSSLGFFILHNCNIFPFAQHTKMSLIALSYHLCSTLCFYISNILKFYVSDIVQCFSVFPLLHLS